MSTSGSAGRTAAPVLDRAASDPATDTGQTLSLSTVVAAIQRVLAHRRGSASWPGRASCRLGEAVIFGSPDIDEWNAPVQLGLPLAGAQPRVRRSTRL